MVDDGSDSRGQVNSIKTWNSSKLPKPTAYPRRRSLLHLAPNILGPVIVYATLLIPAVMLLESTLSFLGLGRSGAQRILGYAHQRWG